MLNNFMRLIYNLLPESIKRLYLAVRSSKSLSPPPVNNAKIFETIYNKNYWDSKESVSGPGSSLKTTQRIREALPDLWKKYDIKIFLDVPCGDFNWMKEVDKSGIQYIGADIVKPLIDENKKKYGAHNINFTVLDITKDALPKVDMIFCKDCLQHLSNENVFKALRNFKNSGSKYLFTTSYPLTLINWDITDGDYRPLNLQIKPFQLPRPLYILPVKPSGENRAQDRCMLLYEVEKICQ